ncbi:MAG: tetratricopeptide repeat protein [Pyrinomonadaceae bacterium]
MRKRALIAIVIAFTLTFGMTALWTAETDNREGDVDANIIDANGAPTGKMKENKKGGNRVAGLFKAPFRAIGRLFGRGKDDGKPQRLTEKDVAKFESAGLARVDDSRSTNHARPSASGSARDHLATGRALLLTGRVNDAIAELSLAASLDPTLNEAHSLLGVAFDRKGMSERAAESYNRAIKAAPEDAQTLNNLGFSLYQNGKYRAAVDRLKRATRLAPGDQRIWNNLALAQCRLGKTEDCFKSFTRAGGELTGRLNTATLLERMGHDTEAIPYYEAALRLQPKSSVVLRRLADLYRRAGRPDDAQAKLRALGELGQEMATN